MYIPNKTTSAITTLDNNVNVLYITEHSNLYLD
jgi:hypothetical protein